MDFLKGDQLPAILRIAVVQRHPAGKHCRQVSVDLDPNEGRCPAYTWVTLCSGLERSLNTISALAKDVHPAGGGAAAHRQHWIQHRNLAEAGIVLTWIDQLFWRAGCIGAKGGRIVCIIDLIDLVLRVQLDVYAQSWTVPGRPWLPESN